MLAGRRDEVTLATKFGIRFDLATIDAEIPAAAGDRYDKTGMQTVNR